MTNQNVKARPLITGEAAFIESHVADHSPKLSHKLILLDDLCGGLPDQVSAGNLDIPAALNQVINIGARK